MKLIEPALLDRPDVKAAFPPTARERILRPIIDFINALSSSGNNYEQTLSDGMKGLRDQISAMEARLTALEAVINMTPAEPIADLPASPVSVSATNLVNIGLLSSNENEDRKAINRIYALLRAHKWIKT